LNATQSENLFLPIPNNGIITHKAIREILISKNIPNPVFNVTKQFIINKSDDQLVILFEMPNTNKELSAQEYYRILMDIKGFCIDNQIDNFSTIRMEGLTTLTSFERIRKMFKYIFKETNIKIIVYREQEFSDEEKQAIIAEYHNSPLGGHSGVSRTIKRMKLHYHWKDLKGNVKDYIRKCDIC